MVKTWDERRLVEASQRILQTSPADRALAVYLCQVADGSLNPNSSKAPELSDLLASLESQLTIAETMAYVHRTSRQFSSKTLWSRLTDFGTGPLVGAGVILISAALVSLVVGTVNPKHWTKVRLPGLVVTKTHQEHGKLGIGVDADGKVVTVNQTAFDNVLGTHARSTIVLQPEADIKSLTGSCAYPDRQTESEINCRVLNGGTVLFESKTLSQQFRQQSFSVQIDSAKPLQLEITTPRPVIHNAHGVWLDLAGSTH